MLSPVHQTSYLEGTVIGQAQIPRSYLIEAQGCRYRCNRQHIFSINTHIDSLFSRPYTDTKPQTHTFPVISGPSLITRPPLPPEGPKFIQSEKIPQPVPQVLALYSNNATHLTTNVPTQDSLTQNHLTLKSSPISGPPPAADIHLNKLLMHLVSLNGNPQTTTKHQDTAPSEPSSPTITSSLQSSSSRSRLRIRGSKHKQSVNRHREHQWSVHNIHSQEQTTLTPLAHMVQ